MHSWLPSNVARIVQTLAEAGYQCWIYGGAVRDLLRKVTPSDWNLVTDAEAEAIESLFDRAVADDHGVTLSIYESDYRIESLGPGQDLDDFLGRSDFTLNAVAYDPRQDVLVDPHGGVAAIQMRVLSCPDDPLEVFDADPIRMLRAIRFAVELNLMFEPTVAAALQDEGLINKLHVCRRRRVRDEFFRIMTGEHASEAVAGIVDAGMGPALGLGPIMALTDLPQGPKHIYDAWGHTLDVIRRVPGRLDIRLAALWHDSGKAPTHKQDEDGTITHYGHEEAGADLTKQWMDYMQAPGLLSETVTSLVANHLIQYEPGWSNSTIRRWIRRVGKDRVATLFELAHADLDAHGPSVWATTHKAHLDELARRVESIKAEAPPLDETELAIDGSAIMEILGLTKGGPLVGKLKKTLMEMVVNDPKLNDPEVLKEIVIRLVPELREK